MCEHTINSFVIDVLKHRFPENKFKHVVNEDDDKLNFACPYCGDSEHDVNKKRGNIFLKTGTYKCFNGGCLKFTKLNKFISDFAMKYSLSIPLLSNKITDVKIQNITKRGSIIEFLMNPVVKNILIDFSQLAERFFLTPCIDAPNNSKIKNYIDKRNLLHLPLFKHTCYYDNREDKIYIFNLDLRSGKVLGLSIRRIDDSYLGPKYDIKNYSHFMKNGLINKFDDNIISKIDLISGFFNILNINFSKPITILEGQFDSMFIKNSIAISGVTKSKNAIKTLISKKNARVLFDNDKAGKDETSKLIQEGYKVFLWSKVIKELRTKYQNNRKSINKIKDINDLFNFYIEIGNPLTYNEFNEIISVYFSESIFDLISI